MGAYVFAVGGLERAVQESRVALDVFAEAPNIVGEFDFGSQAKYPLDGGEVHRQRGLRGPRGARAFGVPGAAGARGTAGFAGRPSLEIFVVDVAAGAERGDEGIVRVLVWVPEGGEDELVLAGVGLVGWRAGNFGRRLLRDLRRGLLRSLGRYRGRSVGGKCSGSRGLGGFGLAGGRHCDRKDAVVEQSCYVRNLMAGCVGGYGEEMEEGKSQV
jgi:hypothetical protein